MRRRQNPASRELAQRLVANPLLLAFRVLFLAAANLPEGVFRLPARLRCLPRFLASRRTNTYMRTVTGVRHITFRSSWRLSFPDLVITSISENASTHREDSSRFRVRVALPVTAVFSLRFLKSLHTNPHHMTHTHGRREASAKANPHSQGEGGISQIRAQSHPPWSFVRGEGGEDRRVPDGMHVS